MAIDTDGTYWSISGVMPNEQQRGTLPATMPEDPLYIRSIVTGTFNCCSSLSASLGWRYPSSGFREEAKKGNEVRERRVVAAGRGAIEVKRSRAEEEARRRERELQELRKDVKKLRGMKNKLETFVANHPQLQEECSRALEMDPEGISELSPVSSEGADERTRLVVEKIGLEHDLGERMRFILLHRQLYESFITHVGREDLFELEWESGCEL